MLPVEDYSAARHSCSSVNNQVVVLDASLLSDEKIIKMVIRRFELKPIIETIEINQF